MSRFASIVAAAVCVVGCTLAQADVVRYVAVLTGAAEAPPNASPGTGFAVIDYDDVSHVMHIDASFSGLLGLTSAAHIHCCTAVPNTGTAGVATTIPSFPGFPLGVTAGLFSNDFDLDLASSFNPAFVTASGGLIAARDRLVAGFDAGTTYFNIHTGPNPPVTALGFPGGEIRGFLQVPEPTSLALMALSLAALGATSRRKSA